MSSNPTVLVGGQLKRWRVVMVAIGVLGYGLDQWTKAEAVARLDPYGPPSWFGGFLTLRLIRNPGAAFSMGSTATVLISLFAIAMLIAGVCGNLTDRIFRAPGPLRGHVVDFMSLPHFAVFNVADIFITSTAILVVVVAVFGHHEDDAG